MINKHYKKAFTLVELLTVVVIIGMIASTALIMMRDTGEVKAKVYTKEVMGTIKDAIVTENDDTIDGFLNDFGVIPPNIHFLSNQESGVNRFMYQNADGISEVADSLQKYRIEDLFKVDVNDAKLTKIPMPFMEVDSGKKDTFDHDGDSGTADETYFTDADLRLNLGGGTDGLHETTVEAIYETSVDSAIRERFYTGYLNDYVSNNIDSDEEKAVKDGWNNFLQLDNHLNLTIPDEDTESYMQVRSLGSDGIAGEDDNDRLLKEEFDEAKDDSSIKSFFSDDILGNYQRRDFIPRDFRIDLDFGGTSVNSRVKVLVYSPMLYYVDNASDKTCIPYNNQQAECDGSYYNYIPYLEYHAAYQNDPPTDDDNWYSGFIKFDFEFDLGASDPIESVSPVDNHSVLYINNTQHEFYATSGNDMEKNLGRTDDFLFQMRITHNTGTVEEILQSNDDSDAAPNDEDDRDTSHPFYIPAGEKYIVILTENTTDFKWEIAGNYSCWFMPDHEVTLNLDSCTNNP